MSAAKVCAVVACIALATLHGSDAAAASPLAQQQQVDIVGHGGSLTARAATLNGGAHEPAEFTAWHAEQHARMLLLASNPDVAREVATRAAEDPRSSVKGCCFNCALAGVPCTVCC